MTASPIGVSIVPLVPQLSLPQPSSAHTRASVPPGHGVQEHCLPFTAASALGFLIPSPIRFGWCQAQEVPADGRAFRSPLDRPGAGGYAPDSRLFYVVDNTACRFRGNAFDIEGVAGTRAIVEPGISFFDRDDQQDVFKLHLPYIWRTPEGIDTLFGPLINRTAHGLEAVSGLVETDWYASPVNLVLRTPSHSVHVQIGDHVAHAILIPRDLRRPAIETVPEHARLSRDARKGLAVWDQQHASDQRAYKRLARSRHGRFDT
jgi:hypothetical protein